MGFMQNSLTSLTNAAINFEQELGSVRYHRKKAEIALRAGIFYIKKYSADQDISDLKQAAYYFTLAERYAFPTAPNRIHVLSRVYLSRIDAVESRHQQAYTTLLNIEAEVNNLADAETRAVWCNSIALLYYYLSDFAQAFRYMHEALEIYTELGLHHELMVCLFNCGIYSREIANYQQAFHFFSRALELGLVYGSPFLEYFYLHVGKMCLHNGNDYATSITYIEKGIEILRQKEDFNGITFAYSTIADYYLEKGELDEAMHWFEQCIKLNKSYTYSNSYFLLHYGEALFRLKKHAQAMEVFEHLLAISSIRNDIAYIAKIQRRIAGILIELQQQERAQELLLDCLEYYSPTYDDAEELSEVYRLLSIINERAENPTLALQYYKSYHEWNSKLLEQKQHFENENAKHRMDIEIATREREELKAKTVDLLRNLDAKRGELTALAMALSQKNEVIDKLHLRIQELSKLQDSSTKEGCKSMIHEIELLKKSGIEQWNNLQQHFESIDTTFLVQLMKKFPSLSQIEVKICLLMRLNLTSKDIANVLWISPRTVETHRYQIRKKLHLSKEENLFIALARV